MKPGAPLTPDEITVGMNIMYIGNQNIYSYMTSGKTYKVIAIDFDGWPQIKNDIGGLFVVSPHRFCLSKYTIIGERL